MSRGFRRIWSWLSSPFAISRDSFSSEKYWEYRYSHGGNSGPGSYEHLAEFKANVLNALVAKEGVTSVIEFGCGDGNQLRLAAYPNYVGYDVSPTAISICRNAFASNESMQFFLLRDYDNRQAELALSLDVIFHLVEDDVFHRYMATLFQAALKFVVIYSSNHNEHVASKHVRHRNFDDWISKFEPTWKLGQRILNPYSYDGDHTRTSFSNFYIYHRT